MKGVWIEEFNKPYTYRTDIPTPKLDRPTNMIVRIKAAGFCHTELMALAGDFGGPPGFVPGHEPCGVVAEVGSEVTKFKVGDRVGCGLFRSPCNECRECKRGTTNYCSKVGLGGLTENGGMAEYYLADPNWAVHLPDEIEYGTAAPLMCAGSTIYHSILRADQPKGSIIAIVGLGGLGRLGVQFAKAVDYKCVAVDTRQPPIDLAMSLPPRSQPDLILNPLKYSVETALSKIASTFPGATGVAAALTATDALPAFEYSKSIIEKHGTLVFIGQPKEPVPFHYSSFISGDLTIRAGSLGQASVVQEMVDLVQKEGIEVHKQVYGLEDMERLMRDYHEPGMKGKLVVRVD
jgi:alcohol dehydrogenase, propanol-preferring